MMSQPSFGLVMPSSTGADVPHPTDLWALAEAADRSNLEHLWVSDHIMWWHPMYESLTVLAALAAKTSRVRIGTAVLLLAMRNPVVVAKTLASIERLSEGRLTVGIGVGGEFRDEWLAVGADHRKRGATTDRMIDELRRLWGPDSELHPKPHNPLPIWIGGRSDAALRRAGRAGDGWMGIFLTPERFKSDLQTVHAEAERNGRDPANIASSLYVWTCIEDTTAEARRLAETLLPAFYNVPFEKLDKYAVYGTPEDCAERFAEFASAGVDDFAVAPIVQDAPLEFLERLSGIRP